jgi:hypothetical protein
MLGAPGYEGRIEGGFDEGLATGSPMIDGVAAGCGGSDGGGGGRLIAGPGVKTLPGRKRTSTAGIAGIDGIRTTSGGFFGVDIPAKSLRSLGAPR